MACLGLAWVLMAPGLGAAETNRAMRFRATTPTEATVWQRDVRQKLFSLMMGGKEPQRVPLSSRVQRTMETPQTDCVIEELQFSSLADRTIRVWLARPRQSQGKVGGVLALHGHGGSGEQIMRGESLYWYGRELVRRGYVVIAPDVGQHELQHTNWSLMGERTWDAIRCLDYLAAMPEVDPGRLAVAGLSLGGETAMYVGALDTRVRLVCSSGWLTTVANMKNGHCQCFSFPGLEENFDFADILACVAPRMLICELGDLERAPGGFPIEIGKRAFQEIKSAYRVFGSESSVLLDLQPGGHVFNGKVFWPRLRAELGSPDPRVLQTRDGTRTLRLDAWAVPQPAALPGSLSREEQRAFRQADENARLAGEAFFRCRLYVDGWLGEADPESGLIPRNLRESRDFWNGRDSAADNYPFMVLTAAMTDPALVNGRLLDMLRTETKLTSRVGRLPDDYSFSKRGWRRPQLDLDAIIFDGAEYVKDGLLPISEWMGQSPWSERMIGIVDDIWQNAPIETPYGRIPTRNFEVGGDLLQACSRLFWFTGDRKYLDWGIRLGDYYLSGTNHPTKDLAQLRLIDHGCEVVNGLTELYVAVSRMNPAKRQEYAGPIQEMFDCILEKGRNEHGLLYSWFNPKTGQHSPDLCDTWGYDYDGFYTMWMVEGKNGYREAVLKALRNLKGNYIGACWGDKSADGYADSIEGALNLLNREFVQGAADWVDSQTRLMWDAQRTDGIIEGWHGDGNIARTSLMYALWKTQGITLEPWREDVRVGAVKTQNGLRILAASAKGWEGKLKFDRPRHKAIMKLPMDYARINQFPEWFTVTGDASYQIERRDTGSGGFRKTGAELVQGFELRLEAGQTACLTIEPVK